MPHTSKSSKSSSKKKAARGYLDQRDDGEELPKPRSTPALPSEDTVSSLPTMMRRVSIEPAYAVASSSNDTFRAPQPPILSYRLRDSNFFRVGKVLVIDWSEPASQSAREASQLLHLGHRQIRKSVFSKVRRFVIIKRFHQHSLALAVSTHTNRALPQYDTLGNIGLIYTGNTPPSEEDTGIAPRFAQLMLRPVRALPDLNTESLDPKSTVNYGKIYTIEHNVPVRPFGVIHPAHVRLLLTQASDILDIRLEPEEEQSIVQSSTGPGRGSGSGPGSGSAPAAVSANSAPKMTGADRPPPRSSASSNSATQVSADTRAYLERLGNIAEALLGKYPSLTRKDAVTQAKQLLDLEAQHNACE